METMAPTAAFSFAEYASPARQRIDEALDTCTMFSPGFSPGFSSGFSPGCPARLREAIRYSLLAPGKRLRPLLVLWSAEACGGDPRPARGGGLGRLP